MLWCEQGVAPQARADLNPSLRATMWVNVDAEGRGEAGSCSEPGDGVLGEPVSSWWVSGAPVSLPSCAQGDPVLGLCQQMPGQWSGCGRTQLLLLDILAGSHKLTGQTR